MLRRLLWTLALSLTLALGACRSSGPSTGTVPAPIARGPVTVVTGKPVDVYARVARQIRACWFKPTDPVLTSHVFRAAAAPDGSTTKISIYEQTPEGRRGLKAFTVTFEPSGGRKTTVTAENHRLPNALGQVLVADVGRWSRGNPACDATGTASGPLGSGAAR